MRRLAWTGPRGPLRFLLLAPGLLEPLWPPAVACYRKPHGLAARGHGTPRDVFWSVSSLSGKDSRFRLADSELVLRLLL